MTKFTKNSFDIIEFSIPFIYEDLYEKSKENLIPAAEVHGHDDALAIIASYNLKLDASGKN